LFRIASNIFLINHKEKSSHIIKNVFHTLKIIVKAIQNVTRKNRKWSIMPVCRLIAQPDSDYCIFVKDGVIDRQGSRKLAPLAPPVPDKPHLVGQNES
jgi:hypothetical protein